MTTPALERLRLWTRSSKVLAPVKRLFPDAWKSRVVSALWGGRQGTISVAGKWQLRYDLDDWYWSTHAKAIRQYEPETWFLLDRYLNASCLFIDGGANIGLWSCYAATKIGNADRVVAVEPNKQILPRLRQNRSLNGNGFTVIEHAIWCRSDELKSFHLREGHAASALTEDFGGGEKSRIITVRTISVDAIVDQVSPKIGDIASVVIKLDVEGAELQAITGAAATLRNFDTLVIYEDHGSDRNSGTTFELLRRGLRVYYPRVVGAEIKIVEVRAASDLELVKTEGMKGYNFAACASSSSFDKDLELLCQPSMVVQGRSHERRDLQHL